MRVKQSQADAVEENQQDATTKYLISDVNFQRLRQLQQEVFDATDVSPSVRKLVNVLIEQVNFQQLKEVLISQFKSPQG